MNQPQEDIPPPASEFETSLKAFRAEIDAIDEELIQLICKRSNVVSNVGRLKERQGIKISPLRPAREAAQLQKIYERFAREAFPESAATYIWRHIINGSLSIEGAYNIGVVSPMMGASELVWMAREYFGAYNTISRESQPHVLVNKVRQDVCSIGILPYPDSEEKNPWWMDMVSDEADAPSIFLKLPHLPQAANKSPTQQAMQAFAVAKVAEENFGAEGLSAIAMRSEVNCSMGKLQEAFRIAGLDANWVAVVNLNEMERAHFIEVKGSLNNQAEALTKIRESLRESLLTIGVIGRYAGGGVC